MGDIFSTVGDIFSTVGGSLQYCRGCSVQWGITSVHAGDNISSVVGQHRYCGGIPSILRGITSILWRITSVDVGDSFSTVEVVQYSISTVGRWLQYCGGYSVHWGDNISTCGITSVHAG